jgi:integrase
MATRIDTVQAREKLKPRRPPYWQRLSSGLAVGFRKMAAGSSGTWLAQVYDEATRKQTRTSLGTLDALPAHARFDAARREAEALGTHLQRGGNVEGFTVRQACEAYIKHLQSDGRATTAAAAGARFTLLVYPTKLASIDLRKLAPHHVNEWRADMIAMPAAVAGRAKGENRLTRPRSPATVNRDMASLRAALNLARLNGSITTDAAWLKALQPLSVGTTRRELYLERGQIAKLIEAAPADLAAFLRALALVPLRPGALAALTAADFDKRLGVLRIGKDKANSDRKIKLPPATAEFFAELAKRKLPGAPLLGRADGSAWSKTTWVPAIREAVTAAKLPAGVTSYTLRHSTITDLIGAGLDALQVARVSGTSLQMIEKHYGHLRNDHAAAALAALAL